MTCFGEIATYCWESTTPTINKGDKNNKTGRQAATAKGEWGVVAHSCHLLWITSAIDPNGTVWNVLIPQLPTDYHHFSTYFQKKATEKMWWFNLWHWEAKADEETYEAWPEEWARRVTCRCFVIQCWRLPLGMHSCEPLADGLIRHQVQRKINLVGPQRTKNRPIAHSHIILSPSSRRWVSGQVQVLVPWQHRGQGKGCWSLSQGNSLVMKGV